MAAIVLYRRYGTRDHFLMSTDPMATGIERPLWGPLYKSTGYLGSGEENDYYQLRDIPESIDPTSSTRFGQKRIVRSSPPYERNKI